VACPAPGQPFASEAERFTAGLVLGKTVRVERVAARVQTAARTLRLQDRLYANVVLPDGTVLNHRLIEAGLAWWHPEVAPHDWLLKKLSAEAMAAKKGLWADPIPLAPWDFRSGAAPAPEQGPETAAAASGRPSQEGVFITKRGAKYHTFGCRFLDQTKKVITRGLAEERGYAPCYACFPEALAEQETRDLSFTSGRDSGVPPAVVVPAVRPPPPQAAPEPARPVPPPEPDLMTLMARHKPRLHRDAAGQVTGITADHLSALPYADFIGLQDGDIVHQINGVPITSVRVAIDLVERLKNENVFAIVVLRDGRPQTLEVSVP